jgi:hypothetical protein
LQGREQGSRLRLGHVCAAAALMVRGDHGAPPDPETLDALLGCTPSQWAAIAARGGAFDGLATPPGTPPRTPVGTSTPAETAAAAAARAVAR